MVIMGIDPGLCHMGWGVIEKPQGQRSPYALAFGTISPPGKQPLEQRFLYLAEHLQQLIELHQPTWVAIESTFLNQVQSKGVQNTFKLGQVYGIVLLVCAKLGMPIVNYTPASIKKGIAGHGQASKEQIEFSVMHTLSLQKGALRTTHETDALAVALFGMYQKMGTHHQRALA